MAPLSLSLSLLKLNPVLVGAEKPVSQPVKQPTLQQGVARGSVGERNNVRTGDLGELGGVETGDQYFYYILFSSMELKLPFVLAVLRVSWVAAVLSPPRSQ